MFLILEPVMGMIAGGDIEVHIMGNFATFVCSSVLPARLGLENGHTARLLEA